MGDFLQNKVKKSFTQLVRIVTRSVEALHLNTLTRQHVNTSTRQHLNTSTPKYLSTFLLLFLTSTVFGQGKIVLVGGGSEDTPGWSDVPYQWIVQHAANHRIAVVSYTDETEYIPDYFMALGAAKAINIKIDSRKLADSLLMYDSLMKFDAFFFKGGDQSYYYNYFKGTLTQQAIIDKYNQGGVMSGTSAGMSILSGVIFTAITDSVYPDEMLSNFNTSGATLKDDFLPFYPGYLFDTHFTERGRGARLMGFLANWYVNHGVSLTGIGVDDRTAFCIDENQDAIVYGTGAVSLYNSETFTSYQTDEKDKPVADSIHVVQLLHGHTINLNTRIISNGPSHPLMPVVASENGNYQVLLSGSETYTTNTAFLNQFVSAVGNASDTIVVVTYPNKGRDYLTQITNRGGRYVVAETSTATNDASAYELRNVIRQARKILFVENDDKRLFEFLTQGPTGQLIAEHIKRNNILSGFVGEDSRYAGETFVTNHLGDEYNAYYGALSYSKGLGLLATTTIMSNTYDASTSTYYENTTAAVPYAMVHDSLKYGIYLERNGYFKFSQQAGKNYFSATGALSSIVITNSGTDVEYESQPVNTAGDTRNYVGFREMKYTILNGGATIKVGLAQASVDLPYEFEHVTGVSLPRPSGETTVYPNPSKHGVFFVGAESDKKNISKVIVTDAMGRIVLNASTQDSTPADLNTCCLSEDRVRLDLSAFPDGIYFLTWFSGTRKFTALLAKG